MGSGQLFEGFSPCNTLANLLCLLFRLGYVTRRCILAHADQDVARPAPFGGLKSCLLVFVTTLQLLLVYLYLFCDGTPGKLKVLDAHLLRIDKAQTIAGVVFFYLLIVDSH